MNQYGRPDGGFAITPHDTNYFSKNAQRIHVGGAGNIALTTADGSELTLNGLTAGQVLELEVRRVKATGTTATNLVGLT